MLKKINSKSVKYITYTNIGIQVLCPLVLSFPPAIAETPSESELAASQHAVSLGNTLGSDNIQQQMTNSARNIAVNSANSEIENWLRQFGTARVQLGVNDQFNLDSSEIDLLVPVYDKDSNLLFAQMGGAS